MWLRKGLALVHLNQWQIACSNFMLLYIFLQHCWFDVTELIMDQVQNLLPQQNVLWINGLIAVKCFLCLTDYLVLLIPYSLWNAWSVCSLMCFSLILSVPRLLLSFDLNPPLNRAFFCFSRHPGDICFDWWVGSGPRTLNNKEGHRCTTFIQ